MTPEITPEELLADATWVRLGCRNGENRARRTEAGATQGDVARPIGVSVATLSRWERGQRVPSLDDAIRYGEVLKELADIVAIAEAAPLSRGAA